MENLDIAVIAPLASPSINPYKIVSSFELFPKYDFVPIT